ncbi:MAG: SH3-like domain-containing protein [Candidatus Binatia bacterium]
MLFRFKEGDLVHVKDTQTLGHIRTPFYLRGKNGVVRGIRGSFRNPELLAYSKDGLPKANLYWVEFELTHVWNDRPVPRGTNKIYADLFEHWLESS